MSKGAVIVKMSSISRPSISYPALSLIVIICNKHCYHSIISTINTHPHPHLYNITITPYHIHTPLPIKGINSDVGGMFSATSNMKTE